MERTVGVGGVGVLLWGRLGTPNSHSLPSNFYSLTFTHFLLTLPSLYLFRSHSLPTLQPHRLRPNPLLTPRTPFHLLPGPPPPIPSHPHRLHPTPRPTPHSPLPPLPAPPPPIPHTPCCCCYAAERTSFSRAARFRAGTRAKRSTPRKLRGKLRGSSAHLQLRSKLQKLLRTLVVQFNVSSL